MESRFVDWSHERLQGEWDRDDKSDLAWTDDWYDDFPLVWRDGWFSTAA